VGGVVASRKSRMPSVVGLLEQLAARRRVDELCEGADRIQAELADLTESRT
jgi:hypothetical protein